MKRPSYSPSAAGHPSPSQQADIRPAMASINITIIITTMTIIKRSPSPAATPGEPTAAQTPPALRLRRPSPHNSLPKVSGVHGDCSVSCPARRATSSVACSRSTRRSALRWKRSSRTSGCRAPRCVGRRRSAASSGHLDMTTRSSLALAAVPRRQRSDPGPAFTDDDRSARTCMCTMGCELLLPDSRAQLGLRDS